MTCWVGGGAGQSERKNMIDNVQIQVEDDEERSSTLV